MAKLRDMRGIQFDQKTGEYRARRSLCESCGLSGECTQEAPGVQHCDLFVPVLRFKPPHRGFSGPFNTFRVGSAWSRRVRKGSVIALSDTNTESVFAHARVLSVHEGAKHDLALAHALKNHQMKHRSDLSRDDAAKEILRILRNLSGNLIFKANENVTVIYLQRMRGRRSV